MPQSKHRPRHHQHYPQAGTSHRVNSKRRSSPVLIAMLFFALFGLGISYFVAGGTIIGMLVGGIVGAGAGYVFGQQIKDTISKK